VTTRRWIALVIAAVVVVGGAAGGVLWWSSSKQQPQTRPAPATPVAMSVANVPDKLTIGVILTLSSEPGEGEDWKAAANGAQVAAQRLAMGGTHVKLKTVDDKGTTDGARKAVKQLVAAHVAGIVVASEGPHLKGAVEAAQRSGTPLLMPYEADLDLIGDHVWATGATDQVIGTAMQAALASAKVSHPLLINAGDGAPDGIEPDNEITFKTGGDSDKLIKQIEAVTGAKHNSVDSIVVSGPATQLAAVERALQGAQPNLPVFFTPDATSPAFSDALLEADASLSSNLNTVGVDDSDAVALRTDTNGRAMASFLAAVRLVAQDGDEKTLPGDQTFATAADQADPASHDAVIALVHAAAAAQSTAPSDVAAALQHLRLDHTQGLAGPALDFTHPAALDERAVVALRSSDQDLGLRPQSQDSQPRLIWFAGPVTK